MSETTVTAKELPRAPRFPAPQSLKPDWLKQLEEEHGKWLWYRADDAADDVRHRLFEDGYITTQHSPNQECPACDWAGPNQRMAQRRAVLYCKTLVKQAKQRLVKAAKELKKEILAYTNHGVPVENLAEKRQNLHDLKEAYAEAKLVHHARVIAPAQWSQAELVRMQTRRNDEFRMRSDQMHDDLSFIDELKNELRISE